MDPNGAFWGGFGLLPQKSSLLWINGLDIGRFWLHFGGPKMVKKVINIDAHFGISFCVHFRSILVPNLDTFLDTFLIKTDEKWEMCEHVNFDNPPHENLEGQRAPIWRKSHVFSDLKSFPDLGMIFRSILVRFGSHFGSILVIKTRSKKEAKNRG